ncbi:hypothetical protein DVA86_24580 [Streptomyces armeniacus]|uniref:Uncharacterized protein n=1 Tax=Streptomyces armeniacus TaxID=83291 RepID=A0A345XUN2_9ACTN|nr:hypothetical protein [Streptomyces armeniacus]AXK35348.1 hypothetical protein DVA86_24580 [Streptomyces armeniacus]
MRWLEQRLPLHNADDQTADWIAKARTPESRARIRRWSRVETIGVLVALGGLAALFIAPIVTLALAIWSAIAGIDRTDVYWWLWGVAISVSTLGAIIMTVGSRRRLYSCFADGHVSTGRVDRVIEKPAVGDDQAWYDLRVSAELPGGVVLRRRLYRDGNDPRRRIGEPIRFRHNTLDSDDLHDALFDGWPGGTKDGR